MATKLKNQKKTDPIDLTEDEQLNQFLKDEFSSKHPMLEAKTVVYRQMNPDDFIKRLKSRKAHFYVYRSSESVQVIFNQVKFFFRVKSDNRRFPNSKLFLFQHVKRDAVKWVKKHRGQILYPPIQESIYYNLDYDFSKGELVGIDLNHAYWRIAFLQEIISKATYENGLDDDCKAIRLAALAILGRKRYVDEFKGKEVKNTSMLIDYGDRDLRRVYKYIRFYCYTIMKNIADILKDDFESYKVDCLYIRNTEDNIRFVSNYLEKRGLTYKLLTEYEDEESDDEIDTTTPPLSEKQ